MQSHTIFRTHKLQLLLSALGMSLLLLLVASNRPAYAACGGVTDVANEAELNAAIAAFNALPAGACVFTIRLTSEIPLTSSTALIYNSRAGIELVLEGDGYKVDGQGTSNVRTFSISGATVTMVRITVTGANVGFQGSAINNNGGILTLMQSTVSDNQGGFAALNNYQGIVTLTESEIRDNTSSGLQNSGTGAEVTLQRSTVSGNNGTSGGGINNFNLVTLIESTVKENTGSTGGIYNSGGTAKMALLRSTVSGNSTTTFGGGITNTGILTLTNSTVSSNTGGVGGIQNAGRLKLEHVTVTSNSATNAFLRPGGVYVGSGGTLTLANSIIADQLSGDDCGTEATVSVAITSDGYNLDSDSSCLPVSVVATGDIPSGDANLAPLGDHGGSTASHDLQSGSDAIDAIPPLVLAAHLDRRQTINVPDESQAPLSGCMGTDMTADQRGVSRPQAGACDIGSVEYSPPLAVTIGWFSSEEKDGQVHFRWQTLTESGTAGFFILAATDGEPTPLHDDMIPSTAIDSVEPLDYVFSAVTPAKQFYLQEIEISGQISEHGPYELGHEYGTYVVAKQTDKLVTIWLPTISNGRD